ncbi:MAG: hypothetical protein LQ342_008115 [Letrouitia transgressa]|nr:MAG: hypothetical protein LQ342_008115 [Letrouitia transgressa]
MKRSIQTTVKRSQKLNLPKLSPEIPTNQTANPPRTQSSDHLSEHSELYNGWLSVESDVLDCFSSQANSSEGSKHLISELSPNFLERRAKLSGSQPQPGGCETPSPPSHSPISPVTASASNIHTLLDPFRSPVDRSDYIDTQSSNAVNFTGSPPNFSSHPQYKGKLIDRELVERLLAEIVDLQFTVLLGLIVLVDSMILLFLTSDATRRVGLLGWSVLVFTAAIQTLVLILWRRKTLKDLKVGSSASEQAAMPVKED